MVPLHMCGSDTRNEIQGEVVLPNMQESSVRGSPSRYDASKVVTTVDIQKYEFYKTESFVNIGHSNF